MATARIEVSIDELVVSLTNARKDVDAGQEDASLAGLAQSIKEHGLLNALTVRRRADGKYEILAVQRRYLACKQIGMRTLPVVVREDMSDTNAVALSLIENVQRADMHPLDKAEAFAKLKKHHKNDLRLVGESTGVSVQTIQKYLFLLLLPASLRDELGTQHGSAGVGALAAIAKTFDNPEDMETAWNEIGGFTQAIQGEILRRSGGNIEALPGLVLEAQEGAFDTKVCGTGIEDCPHIPDALRLPLLKAVRALEKGEIEPEQSLKEIAARHKKRKK